ncbi:MAG: hypothetical protein J6S33_03885, partial [Aeriscardovia sp.]|nr:hypothetical protein [Aeriscardovia sp.]
EDRGRVARCRITRQGGGVGLVSTGSTPPPLFIIVLSPSALPKKQNKKTKFCVTADKTISFFPCLALVLLTTANNGIIASDHGWL